MSMASVDGIDAMVAPVVLITLGSLLANGILAASTAVLDNTRGLARERDELLDAASISVENQKRLDEINQQLPVALRHNRLLRNALVLIYAGIGVLILSVISIAVAVAADLQAFGTLALAFVLAGTVAEFAGIVTAGWSVATADPTAYVAERHRTRGLRPGSLPCCAS
jgi:Protein of unknown function (DUF2721)